MTRWLHHNNDRRQQLIFLMSASKCVRKKRFDSEAASWPGTMLLPINPNTGRVAGQQQRARVAVPSAASEGVLKWRAEISTAMSRIVAARQRKAVLLRRANSFPSSAPSEPIRMGADDQLAHAIHHAPPSNAEDECSQRQGLPAGSQFTVWEDTKAGSAQSRNRWLGETASEVSQGGNVEIKHTEDARDHEDALLRLLLQRQQTRDADKASRQTDKDEHKSPEERHATDMQVAESRAVLSRLQRALTEEEEEIETLHSQLAEAKKRRDAIQSQVAASQAYLQQLLAACGSANTGREGLEAVGKEVVQQGGDDSLLWLVQEIVLPDSPHISQLSPLAPGNALDASPGLRVQPAAADLRRRLHQSLSPVSPNHAQSNNQTTPCASSEVNLSCFTLSWA